MLLGPVARQVPMKFNPTYIKTFRFVSRHFNAQSGRLDLVYAFDEQYRFCETFEFPGPFAQLDAGRSAALERAIEQLHLLAGISYYKAAVPALIALEAATLTPAEAEFYRQVYQHGLGEFAYRNQLDLTDRIVFPAGAAVKPSAPAVRFGRRTAVPIGGGKDSVVTVAALRAAGEPVLLLGVGDSPIIDAVAATADLPYCRINRMLDPQLGELNRQGALNGHIPISAVLAGTFAVAAVLYDFDCLALSNERSASSGNLEHAGLTVNHQYSKSLEFEDLFRAQLRRTLPGLDYFSFLRPLSELSIARLFAQERAFHPVFSSCNRAFRLSSPGTERWCRDCPKCRFVFLALAPFLPSKEALLGIFGGNLLADERQIAGYDELAGFAGTKPFECVGEIEETRAAFTLLARLGEWRLEPLVHRFAERFLPTLPEPAKLAARCLEWSAEHRLPPRFWEFLNAYSRSRA